MSSQPQHDRSAATRYWWVNQGDTFEDECACGCIFASAAGDGYPDQKHHRNILELRREDALFHYHDRRIVAVSRVIGVELNNKRPYERKGYGKERDGYLAHVEYLLLAENDCIQRNAIPLQWRLREGNPFNRVGGVKQEYLNPLSDGFAHMLIGRFCDRLPESFWPLPPHKGTSV